jgi:hypothetical protein
MLIKKLNPLKKKLNKAARLLQPTLEPHNRCDNLFWSNKDRKIKILYKNNKNNNTNRSSNDEREMRKVRFYSVEELDKESSISINLEIQDLCMYSIWTLIYIQYNTT